MKKVLVLLVVLGLAGYVSAAQNHFEPGGTPGGTGDFNNAANWRLGTVPDYFGSGDDALLYGGATCDVYDTMYTNKLLLGVGWWGPGTYINGQPEDYPNNNQPAGATLNIHPGAYLGVINGALLGYADPNGSVLVNMTGGQFGDRHLLGTTSGWSGWGWGQDFTWNQTGGIAKFFVNTGNYGVTFVKNGTLDLTYLVKNNNATKPQEFVVRSHGVMSLTVTGDGGPQRFYIGVGGTLKVRTTQIDYVKANLRTEGAYTETIDGVWTVLYVPEPATIALLGIGSLLMIRRKK